MKNPCMLNKMWAEEGIQHYQNELWDLGKHTGPEYSPREVKAFVIAPHILL